MAPRKSYMMYFHCFFYFGWALLLCIFFPFSSSFTATSDVAHAVAASRKVCCTQTFAFLRSAFEHMVCPVTSFFGFAYLSTCFPNVIGSYF